MQVKSDMNKKRCSWANSSDLEVNYHDQEWGVPVHDDVIHFEFLTLEGAQAGLSWNTILQKRENYRKAFRQFDPVKVSKFKDKQIQTLLNNPGIVRNRLKVHSTVSNARSFLEVQAKHGSFDQFIWGYVDGKPIVNKWKTMKQVPATTRLSESISKDLKKLGFRFVGPTIVYSYLQATGLINDHLTCCFRFKEVQIENLGHQ